VGLLLWSDFDGRKRWKGELVFAAQVCAILGGAVIPSAITTTAEYVKATSAI